MTILVPEYEQITPTVSLLSCAASIAAPTALAEGNDIRSEVSNFYSLISISGMSKTPSTVSDFLRDNFKSVKNVKAVLAGESADVLHVWVMIGEWTPQARKQVYAIQKLIMKQLCGLHFDFYVIDLPDGTTPTQMVSGIPVIFNRAEQE